MQAVLIPVELEDDMRIVDWYQLEDLQHHVGGFIEGIRYPTASESKRDKIERNQAGIPDFHDILPLINEEGKLLNLPFNIRATLLMLPVLQGDDYISGPMLLVLANESGEEVSIPPAWWQPIGKSLAQTTKEAIATILVEQTLASIPEQ